MNHETNKPRKNVSTAYISEMPVPVGRRDSDPTYEEAAEVIKRFPDLFSTAIHGLRRAIVRDTPQNND